jgi:hypothetical protein
MTVAGDFNLGQAANPTLQKDWTVDARNCWEEALGLFSVYHAFSGEPFGSATRSTYFHLRRRDEGFHLDYVLASPSLLSRVRDIQIGTYQGWWQPVATGHLPRNVANERPSKWPLMSCSRGAVTGRSSARRSCRFMAAGGAALYQIAPFTRCIRSISNVMVSASPVEQHSDIRCHNRVLAIFVQALSIGVGR